MFFKRRSSRANSYVEHDGNRQSFDDFSEKRPESSRTNQPLQDQDDADMYPRQNQPVPQEQPQSMPIRGMSNGMPMGGAPVPATGGGLKAEPMPDLLAAAFNQAVRPYTEKIEQLESQMADMPFDARRMIYGGFAGVHDHGSPHGSGYVDGVLMPIAADGRSRYAEHAARLAPMFAEVGALRVLDAIEDDVNTGEVTDFHRAVRREGDESVGFGFIEWPDKETRDAGWNTLMADERMQNAGAPPYDGKRMIFGGFATILDV